MRAVASEQPERREFNWARNHEYGGQVARPASMDELTALIAGARRVRALGSRHSFNAIADSDLLVDMTGLPERVEINTATLRAWVSAGTTYGSLAHELDRQGMALANLASLPHITVAGSVATGTHGSGTGNGGLATSVTALELVTAGGETLVLRSGDARFAGAVVGLGALGAVVSVELSVQATYMMRQLVVRDVPWPALAPALREVMSSAYSVSLFTRWDGTVAQAWIKQRVETEGGRVAVADPPGPALHAALTEGGRPADTNMHPVGDLAVENCTEQLGIPGPWFERLPHFRMGFTPSSGAELQSEYLLDWGAADDAVAAMTALGDRIRPALLVCEVRAVAGDDLWMSPAFERDSLAIHFTWRQDAAAVTAALRLIEAELLPLGARPHWGKVFLAEAERMHERYPRLGDFLALRDRLDPAHKFTNSWFARHVAGA